jgi:hypothetical protein
VRLLTPDEIQQECGYEPSIHIVADVWVYGPSGLLMLTVYDDGHVLANSNDIDIDIERVEDDLVDISLKEGHDETD